MKILPLRLDDELDAALEAVCKGLGRDKTDVVADVVGVYEGDDQEEGVWLGGGLLAEVGDPIERRAGFPVAERSLNIVQVDVRPLSYVGGAFGEFLV